MFYKIKNESLKNKLLISMPNMVDPYFAKSVIFICEDDTNGTMGIIVNKPISQMKIVSSGIKNKIFEDIINESEKFFEDVRLNEACIVQKNTGKSDDFVEKIELSTDLILYKKYCSMMKHQRIQSRAITLLGRKTSYKKKLKGEMVNPRI